MICKKNTEHHTLKKLFGQGQRLFTEHNKLELTGDKGNGQNGDMDIDNSTIQQDMARQEFHQ